MKVFAILMIFAVSTMFLAGSAPAEEKKPAEQGSLGKTFIDRFDTNGNGQIDPDESEAARAQFGKGRGGRGPGAAGKGGGQKGAGEKNPAKRREEMLKKFDANGNGQLEPAEREAMKAAMEKRRAEMQAKGKGNARGKGAKSNGKGKGNGPQARGLGGPMKEALLKKFDANGNGQLEPDEMQAAKAELQKRRGNKVGKK